MGDRRWTRFGRIWVVGVVGLALSACGPDSAPSAEPPQLEALEIPATGDPTGTETTDEFDIAADAATALPEQADDRPAPAVEVAVPEVAPAPERQDLDQPAIWPAADVVFATPEEAAADFVSAVLISEGDPAFGEIQQGDARSGEIAVLFAGETGDLDPPLEKGVLLLRQIGPTNGWYVIAATSDGAMIDTPSALEEIPAGPATVSGEGRGFEIAQGRLGPGRIHHCMRIIGVAERALEKMCERLMTRTAFGKPIYKHSVWEERIANARIEIECSRLLTFKAAHMMDTVGNKVARAEIAMIKVKAPLMALDVIDDAMQAFGACGMTTDAGLAQAFAGVRTLRLADGPDEVHRRDVSRFEFAKYFG